MSKNAASTNSQWESAYSKYNDLSNNVSKLNAQYSGNAGYENSLKEGAKGANAESQGAQQAAMTSARNAGMSKAAAANIGAQQAASAYGNSYANQQAQAQNAGNNAVINANQNVANQAGAMNASQTEGNNRYNRSWGNTGFITGTVGSLLSDARLKSYTKITSEFFKDKDEDNGKKDMSELIWKKESK